MARRLRAPTPSAVEAEERDDPVDADELDVVAPDPLPVGATHAEAVQFAGLLTLDTRKHAVGLVTEATRDAERWPVVASRDGEGHEPAGVDALLHEVAQLDREIVVEVSQRQLRRAHLDVEQRPVGMHTPRVANPALPLGVDFPRVRWDHAQSERAR